MIRKDIYEIIKRGFIALEAVSVTAILSMVTGIGVGTYFSIIEASKDTSLKEESKTFLEWFNIISNEDERVAKLSQSGLEVFNLEKLDVDLHESIIENYSLLLEFPDIFYNSAIILNDYNEESKTYYSFSLFNVLYDDRYAITTFATGVTNIIYGKFNVVIAS